MYRVYFFSGLHNHQGLWIDTSKCIKKPTHTNRLTSNTAPSPSPAQKITCGYPPQYSWTNTIDRSGTIQREEWTISWLSKIIKLKTTPFSTFLATATLRRYHIFHLERFIGHFLYVRGLSEKISRMLRNKNVEVRFKPFSVLRFHFPRPKVPTLQSRCVVHKINCLDCDFFYYGQTYRALATRSRQDNRGGSSWRQ